MFRASSAHLQEDIVVYKQHMVPSLYIRVLVAYWYAARVRTDWRGKVVGGFLKTPTNNLPPTVSSHSSCVPTVHQKLSWEWQYHMLHVHNCILLKMSTWGSKHLEENSILWIDNNQCIKLVINIELTGKSFQKFYKIYILKFLVKKLLWEVKSRTWLHYLYCKILAIPPFSTLNVI